MTAETVDVPTHGTVYGYRKGCRCPRCVHANYLTNKRWRAKVASRPIPPGVHGTVNGRKIYKCGCGPCVNAKREADDAARQRRARVAKLAAAGLPIDWEGDIPNF